MQGSGSLKVARIGIHGFHESLGVDVNDLSFFWTLECPPHVDHPDSGQTAYRVIVWTTRSGKHDDKTTATTCWDSGRVESDAQRNVACKPDNAFESTTLYFWQVQVWDHAGVSSLSDVAEFFTAYPKASNKHLPPYSMNQIYMPHTSLIYRAWFDDFPNRWKAVWIGDGGDKPIYLRHAFELSASKRLSKAVVFASGLGHFNLRINGQPASETHLLDPGWTDYHRTVQYVAYDVTSKLREGSGNVIGAHVGNGFYAGDKGGNERFFWPVYEDNTYVRYGNELCFFAEIHLLYDDGSREVLTSDPKTWTVRRSATTLANIYASEDHDRRQYPDGWDDVGFDASSWTPAKPLTGPRGKLRYQSQPPVVAHETFQSVSQKTVRPGTVVYDLGQNSSMMVVLELENGTAGAEVVVRYSETVGEDGAVLMPDDIFKQFETGVFSRITLRGGEAVEKWQPDFSFTSARYIQIEGVSTSESDGLPRVRSVCGQHVSSASARLGPLLHTSSEDVNALARACYYTFSSNLFSYHTDCPQVEKFAWLEVTHLLAPTTQYVRDVEALYVKICADMVDAQDSDGMMPSTAPEIRYMPGPLRDTITWGGAICLLPALVKRYYDNGTVLKAMYGPATRYLHHMKTRERHGGGIIEHGLGDWGRDIAYGNHQANIETGIYYACLQSAELMATELGLTGEAESWAAEARRVRDAYNALLLKTDKRDYPYAHYTSLDENPTADPAGPRDRTMVAQAMALQLGLCPDENRADVERALVADCEADTRMRAGEIGLRYLMAALGDLGRPDLVLTMARREEHPSYMRLLRRGETTLPEFWQDACRSKCHDMLGTVYEWMHAAVLGLKPDANAWRTWTLRPPYGSEFTLVEGSVRCPYGEVAVRFEQRQPPSAAYDVRVTVPVGTTATFFAPGDTSRSKVTRQMGTGAEKKTWEVAGAQIKLTHGSYVLEIS